MSAKKKTVWKVFDYMCCDDFAKYLEDMAAKGWHFKEWGVGLVFEKGEPESVTYAVEVFTKASESDTRPEPNTQEFAEYCEAAGWKLVDGKQKYCIFKKVNADALELFTPEERVNNAWKGTTSGIIIVLWAMYGLNAVLQWINMSEFFDRNIFSSSSLFSFLIWNVMFLAQTATFVYAFWKKHSLKKAIKDGKKIYLGINEDNRHRISTRDAYVVLLIAILLGHLYMVGKKELVIFNVLIIVVTLGFAMIIAKVRPSNSANIIIQVVFSITLIMVIIVTAMAITSDEREVETKQDVLPLVITDYREGTSEIDDINIYQEKNILGSGESYYIFSSTDFIQYGIYKSKHGWILDKIWENQLQKKLNETLEDCSKEWGAKKAFRNKVGTYLVRYEDIIFILSEDENVVLTESQINIIRQKMNLR